MSLRIRTSATLADLARALAEVRNASTAEESLHAAQFFSGMMDASRSRLDSAAAEDLRRLIEETAGHVARSRDALADQMAKTASRLASLRARAKPGRRNAGDPTTGSLA